ncbi:MAG: hypothetical protein K9N47_14100 [Prosthecobacter sp.]|uniref:hypothetical protein n=1 Tax=Prosthecobacter sp. TaxID=1965333 RepID=UPI0025DFF1BE|nr:hypothetical protein [Prosthecobacter sp.]MCF7787256.1 hypothetical protein [Prosthecobacter sp.]
MTAPRKHDLSKFCRVTAALSALLLLAACALPDEAFKNYSAATKVSQWNSVLDALGGGSVKRAESAGNAPLFNGAVSMNVPTHAGSINDISRLFAGMDSSYSQTAAVTAHKQRMNSLWATHQNVRRGPLQSWAAAEIGDIKNARAMFYPFSGPDFLFASALFPSAETYVLCGLEPAEPLPRLSDLSQAEIDSGLTGLHNAVANIMQNGYFITTEMRSNLQATRFRGVLPLLMAFMARTGHTVESVDTVRLDGAGNVTLSGSSGNTGLMIRCRSGVGSSKRVFYFRQDLSNAGVSASGPFLTFVSRLGRVPAFLKSASYLMHEGEFSSIRDYLLRHSSAIVQDPSGVPYHDFSRYGWNLWLYGNYHGTLEIFSGCQQPDLVAAYSSGRYPVKPLNFGIGYLMNPQTTSLMVGRPGR